jgi:hypothetical protein
MHQLKKMNLLLVAAIALTCTARSQVGDGHVGVPGGAQVSPGFFPQSIYAGPYAGYFDDYLTSANVSVGSALSGGTGSCAASTAYLDNTSPGNISITGITTATGSEGWGCLTAGGIYQLFDAATAPSWTYETRVQWAALPGTTAASYQVGMVHTYLASPWTTGIGFYLSSANANANHLYCEYSSTLTDSTISAVASKWTRLSIYDDGVNVRWYVNGVEATACTLPIASLPTSALYMAFTAVPTNTSTTITMGIDYLLFHMNAVR